MLHTVQLLIASLAKYGCHSRSLAIYGPHAAAYCSWYVPHGHHLMLECAVAARAFASSAMSGKVFGTCKILHIVYNVVLPGNFKNP